jgi:hypothetical protein
MKNEYSTRSESSRECETAEMGRVLCSASHYFYKLCTCSIPAYLSIALKFGGQRTYQLTI